MDASKARKEGFVRSSLCPHASRNDGSCGKGHSGCMKVKKSSMRAFRVGRAHISSAESWAGCDDCSCASAWAALVGDCGVDDSESRSPILRFLIASACLLGGPRRRLGRSKVHGISSARQALHGGPDSSHYRRQCLS